MTKPFAASRTNVATDSIGEPPHTSKGKPAPLSLLTVDAVAERLDMCAKTIRRLIDRGELRIHRFGRLIRISEDDLARFIKMGRE